MIALMSRLRLAQHAERPRVTSLACVRGRTISVGEITMIDRETENEATVEAASADTLPHGLTAEEPAPRPERPTQADLAKIVDAKAALAADTKWDDPLELQIHALIHRAWAMEIERKGGSVIEIGADDMRALRMAQAAIRLVPVRPMAAVTG